MISEPSISKGTSFKGTEPLIRALDPSPGNALGTAPVQIVMRSLLCALTLSGSALAAQAARPPALHAVRATGIRHDVNFLAGDYFRRREAGSPDGFRASTRR